MNKFLIFNIVQYYQKQKMQMDLYQNEKKRNLFSKSRKWLAGLSWVDICGIE